MNRKPGGIAPWKRDKRMSRIVTVSVRKTVTAHGSINSIRIPAELQHYIDLQEGKLVELAPVPESLQDMLKEFKESWDKAHDPADLSEYKSRVYKVVQAEKVTIRRYEYLGADSEEVNTYKLDNEELVIYHPDHEAYISDTGELYQPVGDPIEGFVNVGCCTIPATTVEEDVFLLVRKALGGS